MAIKTKQKKILIYVGESIQAQGAARLVEAAGHAATGPFTNEGDVLEAIEHADIDGAILDFDDLEKDVSCPVVTELQTRGIPHVFLSACLPNLVASQYQGGSVIIAKPLTDNTFETVVTSHLKIT